MGGYVVLFVSVIIMLMLSFAPSDHDGVQSSFAGDRPAMQAVASNMIHFHKAAIDFVSQPENRDPVGGSWVFSFSSQAEVRCSTTYTGGTYDYDGIATAPNCTAGTETEFKPPSYITAMYDWAVYYESDGAGGSPDILVTYVQDSSHSISGYNSEELAAGLGDYDLASESQWYWGITPSSGSPLSLDNGVVPQNLPAAFAIHDVAAIATIIP